MVAYLLERCAVCWQKIAQCGCALGNILAGVFLSLLLSGCDSGETSVKVPVRPVKIVVVKEGQQGETLTQVGSITAEHETLLGFQLNGRITERSVEVGDEVAAGQVVAKLDSRDAQNQLQSAKADLASAESAEKVERSNFERIQKLAATGVVSQSQLEQATATMDAAVSRLRSAQAGFKSANDNLGFTRLVAPESGVVISVSGNAGQVVAAGQEVVRIASLSQRLAVFDVPEKIILSDIKHPQITVSLLADRSISTSGRVRDLSPQADPTTRTYRVRVALENPPESMALGATVIGSVTLANSHLIRLPATAITRKDDQPAVYVVAPETQTLVLKTITVDRYSDDAIFVSDGLAPGDRVVVAGVSKLRPGQPVLDTGNKSEGAKP